MRKSLGVFLVMLFVAALAFGSGTVRDDGPGGAEVNRRGVFPIVDEKVTLKFTVPHTADIVDLNTNAFSVWKEEQTNVHIEYEMIPGADYQERLNLILASNDYPDAFFSAQFNTDQLLTYGVKEQLLLPLNDLIDEYGDELIKMYAQVPGLEGLTVYPDGNVYALPKYNGARHVQWSMKMWINHVWLDALGLPMPTTTDEFEDVLVAFRDDDPNQNGENDEIPLMGNAGWNGNIEGFLMNAFIFDDNYGNDRLIVDDGVVTYAAAQPEFRNGLRWMNHLYEEGLIYPASWTQAYDQGLAIGMNPDAALVGAFPGGITMQVADIGTERYRMYEAVPPLAGPAGERNAGYFPLFGATPGVFAISSETDYADVAFRWADSCYSYDSTMRMREGEFGVDWQFVNDKVNMIGEPAKFEKLTVWTNEAQNQHFGNTTLDFFTHEIHLMDRAFDANIDKYDPLALEKLLFIETQKYDWYTRDEVAWTNRMVFTLDENQRFSTMNTEIKNYTNSSIVGFITGDLDIEDDWDDYVDNLNGFGLQEYMELLQTVYTRQNG